MIPACLAAIALNEARVVVDRIEDDRVVVEWCDRTTSDLPATLFAPDVREGAIVTLVLQPTPNPSTNPLPEPREAGTDPHGASRPGSAAPETSGQPRTESAP